MLKKLLVSLLSAMLCMTVVAESGSNVETGQNNPDNNSITIDKNGDVFVSPLWFHISDEGTAEVIWNRSYKNMESVVIPSEIKIAGHVYPVTSIGYRAFDGCSSLTNVNIPSSVTNIRHGLFWNCSGLTHIEIPSSVTHIGNYAFYGCSGLTSIEIPSNVTSIGGKVFDCCSELTSINVAYDNSIYTSEDGVLYDKNKTEIIRTPEKKKENFKLPSSVTSIGNSAFRGCRALTNIDLPSGVTSIGQSAFMGCSGLTSIEIPSRVTDIYVYAFRGCSGLTHIVIPSSVTSIGYEAFYLCENLDVVINNSKENVTVYEDAFYRCKSVKFLK